MTETLEQLFRQYYTPSAQAERQREIEEYHRQLIGSLEKQERKKVLRIIDAKDMIEQEHTLESFVCGFRLAWRILSELYGKP
ncbi:DUF6809 family protein [Papillibacter cinnamivorans]|uniref:Uncharacterized protein n=1 Tax=Papillibacter cinnamivorans DSM 12816 TaxID=1122930 RepID=A0A1W2C6B5_9FIRM|nr:DUF6809 family protein [Papillibacter cinnamivorans]SMC80646.1 hypothetical protein SAMN02745168_2588 [Papillibacter cinnamivorans DSM 12816]